MSFLLANILIRCKFIHCCRSCNSLLLLDTFLTKVLLPTCFVAGFIGTWPASVSRPTAPSSRAVSPDRSLGPVSRTPAFPHFLHGYQGRGLWSPVRRLSQPYLALTSPCRYFQIYSRYRVPCNKFYSRLRVTTIPNTPYYG